MAFSAKQKMYNFAKSKTSKVRKAKKRVKVVKAIEVKNPIRRPIAKRIPVAREVVYIEKPKSKEASMPATKKRRKTRRKSVRKAVRRHVKRARRTVAKTYRRVSRRSHRVAKRVHRGLVKNSGGIITSNKKESLLNLASIGAGFIGTMAIMNLAPIPATIKNAKWKGGALAAIMILGALKVKDKKAKLAMAGSAVYGMVDLLRNYVPQLASLSGYDSQRALILSGAVQSRGRTAVGGSHGRTVAVGYSHPTPSPVHARPSNRAMVTGSSHYRGSEGSFTSGYAA